MEKKSEKQTLRNLGMGISIGALILVASGAKLSWPTMVHAAPEIWTTKTPATPSVIPDTDVAKLNQAFTNLASSMSPTVVNIYTKTGIPQERGRRPMPPGFGGPPGGSFEDFFFGNPLGPNQMRPREAQALGSGFVINSDGYIVTNSHVVRLAGKNADEIMVKFIGEENDKGHPAKVVGADDATDVALLKLIENKPGIKPAPLGDSDKSKVGEWVVAIGNPYGHTNSLTQGIVSALGRSLEGARPDFIQTSANINPGNSGGPLINLAGEVIGINTAIDPRAQGIGFAIPINTAKSVISQLMTKGRVTRGWMGIGIQELTDDLAGYMKVNEGGVLVREVIPGQPAQRAGIEPYDVITKVNGQPVRNSKDLVRTIEKISIGQTADVEVVRENQRKSLNVRIVEQPSNT